MAECWHTDAETLKCYLCGLDEAYNLWRLSLTALYLNIRGLTGWGPLEPTKLSLWKCNSFCWSSQSRLYLQERRPKGSYRIRESPPQVSCYRYTWCLFRYFFLKHSLSFGLILYCHSWFVSVCKANSATHKPNNRTITCLWQRYRF